MDPLSFLKEECDSVKAVLSETLRHDYGPARSREYFRECSNRLEEISSSLEDDPQIDRPSIAEQNRRLSALGDRISLIERSHLGEFSWPFSEVIRGIADQLFKEVTLEGDLQAPIVHVVAEGMAYKIVNDELSSDYLHRIVIVAFPRHLKHHVLLHSLFGHELGHTAFLVDGTGNAIETSVLPLFAATALSDEVQLKAWLSRSDAPAAVRRAIQRKEILLDAVAPHNWRIELICDLFGLLLFGPPFVAAHRTLIEAYCDDDVTDLNNPTHPPYPVRRSVLAAAVRILGWDVPVSKEDDGYIHGAENQFLEFVARSDEHQWYKIISDDEIRPIIKALVNIISPYPEICYVRPRRREFLELMRRLSKARPPIAQTINKDGFPFNARVKNFNVLYAGWAYWFGIERYGSSMPGASLSFMQVNRLCDLAILQQNAIELSRHTSEP